MVNSDILEFLTRSPLFPDLVCSRKPGMGLLLVYLLAEDRQIPKIKTKNQLSRLKIEPLQLPEVDEYRHCQQRK